MKGPNRSVIRGKNKMSLEESYDDFPGGLNNKRHTVFLQKRPNQSNDGSFEKVMSIRCSRSLQRREDNPSQIAQKIIRGSYTDKPLMKLIPDFERAPDRQIVIGSMDVNEKRFECLPSHLINLSSKYKHLGCCIAFNKQINRYK